MLKVLTVITALLVMDSTTMAETMTFEADPVGSAPAGWTVAKTGTGNPKWGHHLCSGMTPGRPSAAAA
jgi:hypothetical protein